LIELYITTLSAGDMVCFSKFTISEAYYVAFSDCIIINIQRTYHNRYHPIVVQQAIALLQIFDLSFSKQYIAYLLSTKTKALLHQH